MKCPRCNTEMKWNDLAKLWYCPRCMYETKGEKPKGPW